MQYRLNPQTAWGIILVTLLLSFLPQALKASPPQESVFRLTGTSAWLGVVLRDVSAADVKAQKLPGDYGAVIDSVEDDSPAGKAGLKAGDVLVEFAGREIWSVSQLTRWVEDTPVGRSVQVKFFRDGMLKLADVTLESHSRVFRMPPVRIPPIRIPDFSHFNFSWAHPRLGITGQTLTSQLAQYFGVERGKGVLVTEVRPGSAAEKAGLEAGDCILRFGSKAIAGMEDLESAIASAPAQKPVTLTILRNHRQKDLTVSFPEAQRNFTWPAAVSFKT